MAVELRHEAAYARRLAAAALRNVVRPGRSARMKTLGQWLLYLDEARLPHRWPRELWPGVEHVTATVAPAVSSEWELPYGERAIVGALVRHLEPACVFELGTYTGTTTTVIADAAPRATVHTIDLPDDALDGRVPTGTIGREFAGRPEYEGRIVLHRAAIEDFDFTPFHGAVDLVFVDASHRYEHVMVDSRVAFDLVAPGGVVLWDDYGPDNPGVVRALNELARHRALVHIAGTRLAAFQA